MFIDYLRIAKQTELKPHNRLQRRGIIVTMTIQIAVFYSVRRSKCSANKTTNSVRALREAARAFLLCPPGLSRYQEL
jgi:hypothetical protein